MEVRKKEGENHEVSAQRNFADPYRISVSVEKKFVLFEKKIIQKFKITNIPGYRWAKN